MPQEAPHLGSKKTVRSNDRGLRSEGAIERRKMARSQMRWKLRKDKKKQAPRRDFQAS